MNKTFLQQHPFISLLFTLVNIVSIVIFFMMGMIYFLFILLIFLPISIYILENHKKEFGIHICIIFITFLTTISTAIFIPTTIYTTQEERAIKFGQPYTFLIQNSSYDRIETFSSPISVHINAPREHVTDFLPLNFLKSFLFFFIIFELLYFCVRKIKKYHKNKIAIAKQ